MYADAARRTRSGLDILARSLRLSTAVIRAGYGGVAIAQDAPVLASTSNGGDIVARAQNSNERLQNVPIAISAIGNRQLLDAHIVGNRDLARMVLSLAVKPRRRAKPDHASRHQHRLWPCARTRAKSQIDRNARTLAEALI